MFTIVRKDVFSKCVNSFGKEKGLCDYDNQYEYWNSKKPTKWKSLLLTKWDKIDRSIQEGLIYLTCEQGIPKRCCFKCVSPDMFDGGVRYDGTESSENAVKACFNRGYRMLRNKIVQNPMILMISCQDRESSTSLIGSKQSMTSISRIEKELIFSGDTYHLVGIILNDGSHFCGAMIDRSGNENNIHYDGMNGPTFQRLFNDNHMFSLVAGNSYHLSHLWYLRSHGTEKSEIGSDDSVMDMTKFVTSIKKQRISCTVQNCNEFPKEESLKELFSDDPENETSHLFLKEAIFLRDSFYFVLCATNSCQRLPR
jgi:hypothetical protein